VALGVGLVLLGLAFSAEDVAGGKLSNDLLGLALHTLDGAFDGLFGPTVLSHSVSSLSGRRPRVQRWIRVRRLCSSGGFPGRLDGKRGVDGKSAKIVSGVLMLNELVLAAQSQPAASPRRFTARGFFTSRQRRRAAATQGLTDGGGAWLFDRAPVNTRTPTGDARSKAEPHDRFRAPSGLESSSATSDNGSITIEITIT
ncbi:MAG: hypothetical protein QOC63_1112, partial [Mycobacterium sp.]|nr:hypothetical protein [Mycobacterium sp.]